MSEKESRFQVFRRKKKAQQQAVNNHLKMENMELQSEVMKLRLENAALHSTVQTLREVMAIPTVASFPVSSDFSFEKSNETYQESGSMVGVEEDDLSEFDNLF